MISVFLSAILLLNPSHLGTSSNTIASLNLGTSSLCKIPKTGKHKSYTDNTANLDDRRFSVPDVLLQFGQFIIPFYNIYHSIFSNVNLGCCQSRYLGASRIRVSNFWSNWLIRSDRGRAFVSKQFLQHNPVTGH